MGFSRNQTPPFRFIMFNLEKSGNFVNSLHRTENNQNFGKFPCPCHSCKGKELHFQGLSMKKLRTFWGSHVFLRWCVFNFWNSPIYPQWYNSALKIMIQQSNYVSLFNNNCVQHLQCLNSCWIQAYINFFTNCMIFYRNVSSYITLIWDIILHLKVIDFLFVCLFSHEVYFE